MHQKEQNRLIEKGRSHLEEFQEALFKTEAEEHLSTALDYLEEVNFSDSSERDKALAVTVLETHALKLIKRARVLFEAQRPPVEEDIDHILRILKQLTETSLKTKYDFNDAWNKLFDSGIEAMTHSRITDTSMAKVSKYLRDLELR